MKINKSLLTDYKTIILTTNLQPAYQEFIKFFRLLAIYLKKEMSDYDFQNNIVENGMDYSYFQFTDKEHKSNGLKFVIAFIHKSCEYNIWLSGYNRQIQKDFYTEIKGKSQKYEITPDPNRFDYILKFKIETKHDYDELDLKLREMKEEILKFVNDN